MSKSETGYVYTLNDPRTGSPKYVGATTNPRQRFYTLVNAPHNDKLESWIEELESDGLSPSMSLVRVADVEELPEHEREVLTDIMDSFEVFNKDLDPSYTRPKGGQTKGGTVHVKVSDRLYEKANEVSEAYDITIKEAINRMAREGGYDV